ncbi:hypothetical protein [Hymenobacter metallicola]|uniref:Lipoprotein n=1 Tax=Hymenobacter metallicola TaxID=2563114 RepID=A0A4Z0QEE3_9BACT|nr:hypothetical protein [Hymenobacter metallicola]TGE27709.1 hypothetical protein E5K02_15195 [Hymenobacter metallicola]
MNIKAWAMPFLLSLGGLTGSCGSSATEIQAEAGVTTPMPAAPAAVTPAACRLPVYNISAEKERHPESQRLSDAVVARLAKQNPQLPHVFAEYNHRWNLYALDTVRCQGFLLVPMLYQEYDYYADIYYLTLTPDGRKVLDWAVVAATGGDEGWKATAQMQQDTDGRLRVTATVQDTEGGDSYVPVSRDSVVVAYALTPRGRIVRTLLDSVHKDLPKLTEEEYFKLSASADSAP